MENYDREVEHEIRQMEIDSMRDRLPEAKRNIETATFASDRGRNDNAQVYALLAIANALVALVDRLDDLSQNAGAALRIEMLEP